MTKLRWVAGHRDAAAKLYDEAATRHPDDPATLLAACDFAESSGQPDRAEALFRRALKSPTSSGWAARRLAVILSKRPDPSAWNEAWALVAPGGPGAGETPGDRLLRASLLEISPDPARRAEASAALASLVEDLPASHPIAVRARVELATLLLQAGKPSEAAGYIAPATEDTVPADPAALALAVEILARAGQRVEADRRLSRLTAVEPDSSRTTSGRAWVLHAQGRSEEAIATIEEAASTAEKVPGGETRLVHFFNQFLEMKQLEAAERLARKIARLWPKDAWILANFLNTRGRTDEALDACRVAAKAGAAWEPLKLATGLVMNGRLDRSQGEKARAIAETIVAGRPKDMGLIFLAISLAKRQGRYEDALKTCRQAFEANPSDPICLGSLNNMAWILCEQLGRPAEALVEIDRVLKVAASSSARDTRGVILTRVGRLDEAVEELERCVREEPAGNRYLHLARAYLKAGKVEQYRTTLDRAKKAGINPAALSPEERDEFAAVIGR